MPRPTIGFWTAVTLVLGNMIGSGVFLLPASLAPYGGLALAGWLLSAAGSVLLALVFARLARLNPAAGGIYAYTREAFGDLAGFLVAWGYWISIWCAEAALAVACVGYLDPFIPSLVRAPASAAIIALTMVWLLTAVNIWGLQAAARVQFVTTALKILPLIVIGIAGIVVLQPSHFPLPAGGIRAAAGGVTATATLTLWAFLGIECATIPAGAIRDPERTIPRATVTGALVAAVIYILSTVGVMGVLAPSALAASTAPFADAARVLAGDGAAAIVAVGAAVSCFGALNGWILIAGQFPLAVARDGLFPIPFARLSRRDTPAAGMIIGSTFATALVAANFSRSLVQLFTFIILLSTLSSLVPYAFCSLAVFLSRRSAAAGRAVPRAAAVIASLAFAYSLWAIAGAGADVVYWGFLLLFGGLPVYVWIARSRLLE